MAIGINYTIRDAKNARSNHVIYLNDATSPANAFQFAAAAALLIGPLVTGGIERIGVVFEVDVPALAGLFPQAGSDVEEGARFSFRTVENNFTRIRLATFDEQFIAANSREVDIADPAVDAFLDMMLNGLTVNGTGVAPVDSRDEDLQSLASAKESFTSSRNP